MSPLVLVAVCIAGVCLLAAFCGWAVGRQFNDDDAAQQARLYAALTDDEPRAS